MSKKVIGIDLGTTNSAVAVMGLDGKPKILENEIGARTTPSVVFIDEKKKTTIVGKAARAQAITNSLSTIFAVKRFIGQDINSVKKYLDHLPYKVINKNGQAAIDIEGHTYTPEEISAKILSKLVADAEQKLGHKVTDAVITVPAYFNDDQRQATKNAAKIAGLNVERLVNEPTAAALAYGLDKKEAGKIAVYDLGGGTFDISILEISDGVIEVKSTNGDTLLGGEDFDNLLINYVADKFKQDKGVDLLSDPMAKQRLKEACEKAKIDLSSMNDTSINLPFITANASGPMHLEINVTRAQFENLVNSLIEKTKAPCQQALKDAGLTAQEIDDVILVGGMTRMPAVVSMVEKIFNKKPHQGVNPDEVVALGAAIQAGIMQGDVKDVLLLDVTPLSLGIETEGGIFARMIDRNTTIPTKKSQVYSTAADNQTSVTIRVFQGERDMAADNKLLGQFDLIGIESAPRGVPQIEVSFDIDANGIVQVSAKDKKTGKEQQVRIQNSAGLSEAEIQKAINDAQEHAEEDKKRKSMAEKISHAETLKFATEKGLSEHGEKLTDDEKNAINNALSTLNTGISEKDEAKIDSAMSELNSAAGKLAQLAHEASKGDQQSAEAVQPDSQSGNPIDV